MATLRVVAIAGSLRRDSWNKKLLAIAADAARAAGADVQTLDLKDLALPMFDEDLERESPPASARRLKDAMIAAHGLLFACPEYNSSITAALKNAIDWASRPAPGEASLAAFAGKVAGLMAASPGALGGLRGLVTVRSILGNIGVIVLPDQVAVMKAHEAFDAGGKLKDAKQAGAVAKIAGEVVRVAGKLTG